MTKRQYIRFSLRTFLLINIAIAAWIGMHLRATTMQRDAVAAIQKYGGRVRYDYEYPNQDFGVDGFDNLAKSSVHKTLLNRLGIDFFHTVVEVDLNYPELSFHLDTPRGAFGHLKAFPELRILRLRCTKADDENLRAVSRLSKLERLSMWDAFNITDAGVQHLRSLKRVKSLQIHASQITDESMLVFASWPNVERLSLQYGTFTNEALQHIRNNTKLTRLTLGCGSTTIDDNGLRYLSELTNLETIGLQNSHVTPNGLNQLSHLTKLRQILVDAPLQKCTEMRELKEKLPVLRIPRGL